MKEKLTRMIALYAMGNGLKTTEVMMEMLPKPQVMQADVGKILALVR